MTRAESKKEFSVKFRKFEKKLKQIVKKKLKQIVNEKNIEYLENMMTILVALVETNPEVSCSQ